MKIKGNIFVKTFRMVTIVFVFILCGNTNTASASTNSIKLNHVPLSTITASTHTYALTNSWSEWWKKWWKDNKNKDEVKRKNRKWWKKFWKNAWDNNNENNLPEKRKRNRTDSIPLDGGLGILLLGAAAFGVKKLRGKK
ncbi:PID-CTERM protein-sorting domain-containing protein [Seonamhaeicola sp.]|uniref:PID-CTERM protein-sorting domain-containing protein n=1 Tax=Seonamhaeicola sp. TaxID=1912245 RepID=UPI002604C0FB|nr:hypothetical protein [Seonamhaeicola sp.]